MLRGTWERVFRGSAFIGEPPGYFACKWDSLAWNWKINVFNGKYVHQKSMFYRINNPKYPQNAWDSLYFPSSDYTPDIPNKEDLATYGFKEGVSLMLLVKDSTAWNATIKENPYINNVRRYKDRRPW